MLRSDESQIVVTATALDVMLKVERRMLAKLVQTELAQANSVADEVLATMTTVRAHAADDSAKAAYAVKLAKFYVLQVFVYCTRSLSGCT